MKEAVAWTRIDINNEQQVEMVMKLFSLSREEVIKNVKYAQSLLNRLKKMDKNCRVGL